MVAEVRQEQDLLARLNEQQKEAVCLLWGPSLVVAGAGSGKTTVLTRRIAYLISELRQDPSEILAVTFTNKAAQEMKTRIESIVGRDNGRRLWIGTFHSICARLLRQEIENYRSPEGHTWNGNFVIYDEVDSKNLIKGIIKKMNLDEKVFAPKDVKGAISSLKNDGFTAYLYAGEARTYRENRIAEIFTAYQKDLSRNNALDFDDLILMFTDLLKQNTVVRNRLRERFRHVLIDEFQDTNKAQYDMVTLLTEPTVPSSEPGPDEFTPDPWNERTLMVVGDVDQSIYSWRKADFRIFLGFQSDYKGAHLIKLEENYRSTSTILEIANSIIENNTERIDKVLRCNRGKGSKAQYYEATDEIDEAYYVVEELKRTAASGRSYSDAVILYRTNAQSRAIEEVLIRTGIPYKVVGGTRFYDRQEIKDIVAYLKLIYNPDDGQAFNRVINTPKRGVGKTSLEKLDEFAVANGLSTMAAADQAERVPGLSKRATGALKEFAHQLLDKWRPLAAPAKEGEEPKANPISDLLTAIIRDSGYLRMLEEAAASEKDELAYGRIENIQEFIAVAKEFEEIADEPDLESFLTRISLVSDLDQVEMEEEAVKLMTLHSAKGLEFPVVFLMGLEDGLFPHMRSLDQPAAMEEERRLMYVGVTRAEDRLFLTRARKRTMLGRPGASGFSTAYTIPSRFLKEVTPGLLSGYYPAEGGGYDGPLDDTSSGYESEKVYDEPQQGFGRSQGGYGQKRFGDYDNNDRYGQNDRYEQNDRYGRNDRYDRSGDSNRGYGYDNKSQNRYGYGSGSARPSSSSGAGGSRYGSGGAGSSGNSRNTGNSSGYAYGNRAPANGRSPAGGGAPARRASASTPAKPRAMRLNPAEEPKKNEIIKKPRAEHERLAVGDKVQHSKFGTGEVMQVIGEGDKELYNVEFDQVGKRLLDPAFAKLIKLS